MKSDDEILEFLQNITVLLNEIRNEIQNLRVVLWSDGKIIEPFQPYKTTCPYCGKIVEGNQIHTCWTVHTDSITGKNS